MHQASALLNACITHSSYENNTALPQFYIMCQIKAKKTADLLLYQERAPGLKSCKIQSCGAFALNMNAQHARQANDSSRIHIKLL
jgi:hypothetical protein